MSERPGAAGAGNGAGDGAGGEGPSTTDAGPSSGSVDGSPDPEPKEAASRLKDDERARDAADFARMLEDAISGLVGDAPSPWIRDRPHVHVITGGVHGDVVGGDKHMGTGDRALLGDVVVGRVQAAVVTELRRSFVRPDCYRAIGDTLARRGVAVLQAPAGWGRTTTGLCALAEACRVVSKLRPDTDLRTLDPDALERGAGYLLENWTADQMSVTRVAHLEALSAACLEHGIRLCITTDVSTGPGVALRKEFGVRGGARPAPDAVLERHLAVLLAGAGTDDGTGDDGMSDDGRGDDGAGRAPGPADLAAARQVLERPDVREMLTACVDDSFSTRDLVLLAGRLARLVDGSLTADDLRAELAETSSQNVQEWLADQRDVDRYAFLVALATLNGMSYGTVTRAARQLARRFRLAERDEVGAGVRAEAAPVPVPVFGTPRRERLETARARVVPSREPTPFGPTPVEAVRFRYDNYPLRVLAWVWHEHDAARDVVVDWLKELGGDHDRAVRIRAAAATGVLATYEFDWVRRTILEPWADSDTWTLRESALSALRYPSTHPQLAGPVAALVRTWLGQRGRRNRRLTAIRALGASIGDSLGPDVFRLLRRVSADDDPLVQLAVSDTMQELFVVRDELRREVLGTLVRWSRPTEPVERRETGLLCFLQLAFHMTTFDSSEGVTWPALVWVAATDPSQARRIALLWRRALRAVNFSVHAQDVVTTWAERAAQAPVVVEPLGRLMRQTIEKPYEHDRFRTRLVWLRDRSDRPGIGDVARTLLGILVEAETAR